MKKIYLIIQLVLLAVFFIGATSFGSANIGWVFEKYLSVSSFADVTNLIFGNLYIIYYIIIIGIIVITVAAFLSHSKYKRDFSMQKFIEDYKEKNKGKQIDPWELMRLAREAREDSADESSNWLEKLTDFIIGLINQVSFIFSSVMLLFVLFVFKMNPSPIQVACYFLLSVTLMSLLYSFLSANEGKRAGVSKDDVIIHAMILAIVISMIILAPLAYFLP